MSLSGTGRLIIDGKDIGSVDYEIQVYKRGYLTEGRGVMKADMAILWEFFNSERATLQLEEGGNVTIHHNGLHPQREEAEFWTTGEFPGF